MKKLLILILIATLGISCNNTSKNANKKSSEINKQTMAENLKTVEVDIEGMTCEIGCARTIQSKLSKVDGVTYSKVDFNAKKGFFTFDQNKLSDADITNKIDEIAGGGVYKATKLTNCKEIIKK